VVYVRRTNAAGEVSVLGREWAVGAAWANRLVRCELDLDRDRLAFFTLRRRDPASQPKTLEVEYRLPNRGFQD